MFDYSLTNLRNHDLDSGLPAAMADEDGRTAVTLAYLAEFDARRRYLPAGYPSMHAYCVQRLNLTEDAIWKRLQAARAARRFPAIFHAVAEGRLHLSGVCLLAPYLTTGNAGELLKGAAHKTRSKSSSLRASPAP